MTLKQSLTSAFEKQFGLGVPTLCVRAPGRIEILGNHTDYNNGYALSGAISRDVTVVVRPRTDRQIRCYSNAFPELGIQSFDLDNIPQSPAGNWVDYVRGVCVELLTHSRMSESQEARALSGADIFVESDLPNSGGISSSAALELGVASSLVQLFGWVEDPQALAQLCQRAENNYVGTPCGFLDQASVALPTKDHMLFIDFQRGENQRYPTELIPASMEANGLSFVLAVDPEVKRNLGATGYPARRQQCEKSLVFWSEVLQRQVSSLREVSLLEFEAHEKRLAEFDVVVHKRVKHVIHENERVLAAVEALKVNDFKTFGRLLTASGESAINLYELAEGVPQLRDLVAYAPKLPGVLGARNMGGGFSVLVLALVAQGEIAAYTEQMQDYYQGAYPEGQLRFIVVSLSEGVARLW